ncbi:winged helix-turn-helix domain-containing tetratricopeptide repeat protein [Paraburkholderia domus]|uniref:winged helix-turn-helix domain-containing tetratricopeptide repeat protein n=1 Tax=Paraburkholderia domus TaxID=2793075 RepID=UPI0019129BB3|nr:winged helix-turn-helix domain-containing protein [Paraburkholderia domus]MBK5059776.1 winged helix-turn-helix domain-containing protein [Burkholderia sp. R-70199]CAE6722920.1 Transcriptional regulator HilA [Paraburkholderia domus]CAE6848699.1 Transcriptional regulator HilA [Paraburkholderia domus]
MKTPGLVKFSDFELDVDRYQLRRAGREVRLEHKPMELLILLAERGGELVARAEIVRALWGANSFRDTENGLNTVVRKIRIALDEDPANPQYVKTVKGKGYRLDGIVAPPAAESQSGPTTAVRVIVLPFANMTGDPAQDSFCDALAAETSATLGALRPGQFMVIARTTAARYRRTEKSIAEIARELGVDYVLEGSLTQEGERFRILAQLIRCADQVQVWGHAHEPMSRGALDIQKEIGAALVAEVAPTLTEQQQMMLARRLPVEPAAHDAYLRGRYFWYRRVHFDAAFAAHHAIGGEDFFRSRAYFESAVELDPTYALGYVGLSNFHGSTVVHGLYPPEQGWPLARVAAERALELDPGLPEAHHAMAAVHYFYDWDWRKAEAEFLEALRLNPSYPEARRLYARLLLAVGREPEGHAQMKRAELIDPLAFKGSRAFGLVLSGRHDEVMKEYFSGERSERSPLIYQLLATAFEIKGRFKEAVEATTEALVSCGGHTRAQAIRAQWESGGHDAVLRWLLEDLLVRHRMGYTSPLLLAEIYARLARPSEMFHWLEAALADRSSRLCELRSNPWFQRYLSAGQFRNVIKRAGF